MMLTRILCYTAFYTSLLYSTPLPHQKKWGMVTSTSLRRPPPKVEVPIPKTNGDGHLHLRKMGMVTFTVGGWGMATSTLGEMVMVTSTLGEMGTTTSTS